MTRIDGTPSELKVLQAQQEGAAVNSNQTADAKLREAFTYEQKEDTKLTTQLKVQDFNYENFPKKNRLDASDFANRSLNEVKDRAREHNADFPDKPYTVDYSSFPKPEKFDKKNYGGKDSAYIAWKNAVKEWVEDCKQDIVTAKSTNISSMTEKFERTMQSGFFNIYTLVGITQEEIFEVYKRLDGNISEVKTELDKKAEEIMKNVDKKAKEIKSSAHRDVANILTNMEMATVRLEDKIVEETSWVARKVREEGQMTRDAAREGR